MCACVAIRCIGRQGSSIRTVLLVCSLMLSALFGGATSAAAQEPSISSELIPLPAVCHDGVASVERAVTDRRSVRDFSGEPLSLPDLSQLLWAAQGVSEKIEVPPAAWTGGE